MNKALLFSLVILPSFSFAQKTKMFKDPFGKEKYEVLVSDMKTKHGKFFVYGGKDMSVSGFYKNGLRDSVWHSFNYRGEIEAEFRFNKDTLNYFKEINQHNNVSGTLVREEGQIDTVLIRHPYFFYGENYFFRHLMENIRYPEAAKDNGKMGTVWVTFIIDKKGNTRDFWVKSPLGYGLDEEAVRVLKLLPNYWLPGATATSDVTTEVNVPIRFMLR